MFVFKIIKNTSDVIEKITSYICAFLVFLMFFIVLLQIMNRIFGITVSWTEEISRFLLVWIGMLAASIALKRGGHVGVSFVLNHFSKYFRLVINIIIGIAILVFLVFFLKFGIIVAIDGFNFVSTAIEVKMFWPKLALPIGAFLMIVHIIYLITENINMLVKAKSKGE